MTDSILELKRHVCRYMSIEFEHNGYSQLVGKIFSQLLFAPEPMSLQEIAAALDVSKAAVSVQVRAMEREGVCRKIPISNDRKDYYYISDDLCVIILRKHVDKFAKYTQFIHQVLTSLPVVPADDPNERRSLEALHERFGEQARLFSRLVDKLTDIEGEWARSEL